MQMAQFEFHRVTYPLVSFTFGVYCRVSLFSACRKREIGKQK